MQPVSVCGACITSHWPARQLAGRPLPGYRSVTQSVSCVGLVCLPTVVVCLRPAGKRLQVSFSVSDIIQLGLGGFTVGPVSLSLSLSLSLCALM